MMKKIFLATLFVICAACLSGQPPDTTAIVKSNNRFAVELLTTIGQHDTTNLFISPVSVLSAMAMTYDGAKGRTAKELQKALHFPKSEDETHAQVTRFLSHYKNQSDLMQLANAAFVQEKYGFLPTYMQQLSDYAAHVEAADFTVEAAREKARKAMNAWVSQNTMNKINDLLDKEAVNDLTRLVLLNAVYFNARWQHPFDKKSTRQLVFEGIDNQYVTTFMRRVGKCRCVVDDGFVYVELPYSGAAASMCIFMPTDGQRFRSMATAMSSDTLLALAERAMLTKVDLTMPKFTLTTQLELKKYLKQLGVNAAFSHSANLSKMNGRKNLMIDEVIHKSFVVVDEAGTEAAATTAAVIREKSAARTVKLVINRPFLFTIRDNHNGAILFIGQLCKPTE